MKKKWIISAGVALSFGVLATVAVADRDDDRKMQGPWHSMPMMSEHLDLTDEQQEQLKALREKNREAMHEHRKAIAAMGKEQHEAVMSILTEEQQETFKEMRGKRGRGGKGRHDMRHGGKGAFSRLDLTDEQQGQLKELRKQQRTEIRETRQKYRTALEDVLTNEQREKLETMKDEAFYGGRRWRGKR